jgi:hypothetical protein
MLWSAVLLTPALLDAALTDTLLKYLLRSRIIAALERSGDGTKVTREALEDFGEYQRTGDLNALTEAVAADRMAVAARERAAVAPHIPPAGSGTITQARRRPGPGTFTRSVTPRAVRLMSGS